MFTEVMSGATVPVAVTDGVADVLSEPETDAAADADARAEPVGGALVALGAGDALAFADTVA